MYALCILLFKCTVMIKAVLYTTQCYASNMDVWSFYCIQMCEKIKSKRYGGSAGFHTEQSGCFGVRLLRKTFIFWCYFVSLRRCNDNFFAVLTVL